MPTSAEMFVRSSCLLRRELWLLSQAVLQAACLVRVDWMFLCSFSLIPWQPFQVSSASAEQRPCAHHISLHTRGGRAHCCCPSHFFLHIVFEKWDAAGPRADLLVTSLVCWPEYLGKSLLYWKNRSHYSREVPHVQVTAVSSEGHGRGKQLCSLLPEDYKVAISLLPQLFSSPNCSEDILHPSLLVCVHAA